MTNFNDLPQPEAKVGTTERKIDSIGFQILKTTDKYRLSTRIDY